MPLKDVMGGANKDDSAPVSASAGDEKEVVDKSSAFTVLLHGSLKVEGMVAIVQIG